MVPFFKDFLLPATELVHWSHVANGAMQPDVVVVGNELLHHPPGIVKGKRYAGANALSLDGGMKSFQLAVGLWIIRRRPHVRHAGEPDEFLEILGNELRAVIGDDPRPGFGVFLLGPLDNDLHILLRHLLPDLPMNDETAAAVEQAAQIIKGAADIEMRHIDMPMFMRTKRLHEAISLGAVFSVPLLEQTGLGQYPPGAARTDGNNIPVKHHERQPTIPFQGMIERKPDDSLPLPGLQPKVTRDQTIMFVCLAVAGCPRVELAPCHSQPGNHPVQRNFRSGGPLAAEVNHRIAGIMGNPTAVQRSPSSFFN